MMIGVHQLDYHHFDSISHATKKLINADISIMPFDKFDYLYIEQFLRISFAAHSQPIRSSFAAPSLQMREIVKRLYCNFSATSVDLCALTVIVITCSANGRSALALAKVVLIFPCSKSAEVKLVINVSRYSFASQRKSMFTVTHLYFSNFYFPELE
jgi:hypothetical protein